MKRHFESGASKRRKKEIKESALKKLTPITSFFRNEMPKTFEKESNSNTESDPRDSVNESEGQNNNTIKLEEILKIDDNTSTGLETELHNTQKQTTQHPDATSEMNIENLIVLDIGILDKNNPTQIKSFLKIKQFEFPQNIKKDAKNRSFPYSLLSKKLPNGEICKRGWLCWSNKNESLYCAPCYILDKNSIPFSYLIDRLGYTILNGWKKLYERIPSHENSLTHKENYVLWKNSSKRALTDKGIENLLLNEIDEQTNHWKKLLERYLDIIFFLSERDFLELKHTLEVQITVISLD